MRTRSRTKTSYAGTSYHIDLVGEHTNGSTVTYPGSNTFPGGIVARNEISSITDEGAKPSRGYPPSVRPCSHSKTVYTLNGKGTIQYQYTSSGWTWLRTVSGGAPNVVADINRGLTLSNPSVAGIPGSPASINWVALESAFYEKVNQYLPTTVLSGESIAESSIYKEAILLALNPSRSVKLFVKTVLPMLKRLKRPTVRDAHDIAKRSSSAFLSYNFGIKPAINDIINTFSAHQKVEKRLAMLRQNRGLYVPIRARSIQNSPLTGLGYDEDLFATCRAQFTGSAQRIGVISAYGRVRNDINERGSWRAYADYFGGLQSIVGLAWELIPFSFVVDWVTNAQERVRNLKHLSLGGPFSELSSICCSEKLQQEFDVVVTPGYWIPGSNFHTTFDEPIKVGQGIVSLYNRSLTIPDDTSPLDFSGIGTFQILASGALLLQRT